MLTQIEREDQNVTACGDGLRRHKLARLAEEAHEQAGLLAQEGLAQLLACDVRTVRRDIQHLKAKAGVNVPKTGGEPALRSQRIGGRQVKPHAGLLWGDEVRHSGFMLFTRELP